MQLERLGVIVLFGIIVPGAYLTVFLLLALISILDWTGLSGYTQVFALLSTKVILSSTIFFLVSYLFGVLLRLFAPSLVDKASTKFLKIRYKKQSEEEYNIYQDWINDPFPYENTIKSEMQHFGMIKIAKFIERLNKKYGTKNNTTFINYCKLIIEAHNEPLSKHIQENEAMIRFLSGTSLAFIISFILSILISIGYLAILKIAFFIVYLSIALISFITLISILQRFKYQRRREVIFLWMSIYLLLKGAVSNNLSLKPEKLEKIISMEHPKDS